MAKDRGERRKINFLHAIRKKKIDKSLPLGEEYPMYNNLHQYSKNKIHCSCPDCRGRSTGHGDNSIEQLKISEQRKIQSMESQLKNEDI